MKIPPPLKKGDKVCIISPAGKVNRQKIERGAQILREHGFVVEIGNHVYDTDGIFAGNDEARASDMQKAIENKDIKAIFFARGGYGSLRIHRRLNWSAFFKKPKWLIGFSDITVFHSYISNHNIASLHGVMPAFFEEEGVISESLLKALEVLSNPVLDYSLESHPLNRFGEAQGVLTGGNLSILQSLRGTPLDICPKGKILFIEDISEYHYHIDRMMINLKSGRVLEKISGLIVGHFTDIKDGETPYGKNAYEIIREAVDEYRYPLIFNFPAGHQLPNWPLLMGSRIGLKVSGKEVNIKSINRV